MTKRKTELKDKIKFKILKDNKKDTKRKSKMMGEDITVTYPDLWQKLNSTRRK